MNLKNVVSNMRDLVEFITESSIKTKRLIQSMYHEDGDLVSVASCFHWLSGCDWKDYGEDGYVELILDINGAVDEDMAESYYGPVMSAMASIGKKETIKIIKSIVKDDSELDDYDIK